MSQRRKLLVIDDDPAIFRYLRRGLAREGYQVAASRRQDMSARIGEWQPDVVLLDLAPTHARSQIQAIKLRSHAPIIGLLPAKDSQATISALDAGADDCIAKPFSLEGLAAHISKVLRHDMMRRGEIPGFHSPTLRIDLVLRRIYRGGRSLALTPRQSQLLKLLLDADGRVLAHRDLVHAIWGSGGSGNIALLRKLVQDLRRKIECDPKRPVYISTHNRVGYQFGRPKR
jgi:two-component system KDP operon response regulator KdpE